jgi:hypothetical protein
VDSYLQFLLPSLGYCFCFEQDILSNVDIVDGSGCMMYSFSNDEVHRSVDFCTADFRAFKKDVMFFAIERYIDWKLARALPCALRSWPPHIPTTSSILNSQAHPEYPELPTIIASRFNYLICLFCGPQISPEPCTPPLCQLCGCLSPSS